MKITQEYVILCGKAKKIKYHSKLTVVAVILYDLVQMGAISLTDGMLKADQNFDTFLMEDYELDIFNEIRSKGSAKFSLYIMKHYLNLDSKVIFEKVKKRCIELKMDTSSSIIAVVEGLRAEILEDGDISEETAVLTLLLKQANVIDFYFSKHEKKKLLERVMELKKTKHYEFYKTLHRIIAISDILTWS